MAKAELANCWSRDPDAWARWINVSLCLSDTILAEVLGSVVYGPIVSSEDPGVLAQSVAAMLHKERASSLGRN
jgi:hypothetical protein